MVCNEMPARAISRKTGKTSSRSKGTKKVVRAVVRKELAKAIETKKVLTQIDEQNVSTLGGWLYQDQHMVIPQDDTYSGQQGHWVKGVGHQHKLLIYNPNSISLSVRVMLLENLYSRTDYTTGTNMFEGNSGNFSSGVLNSTAQLLSRINKDKYRTIRDFTMRLSPKNADANDTKTVRFWVGDKRKRNYDGSNVLPKNNYVLFVFPCQNDTDVAGGVNIEVSVTSCFYYKDM